MSKQNDNSMAGKRREQINHAKGMQEQAKTKRPFVEPVVSAPVDVLDATTFFQAVSGTTNIPPGNITG